MRSSPLLPALEQVFLIRKTIGERKPGFFLDFDGTLAPLAPRPELARLPSEARRVLDDIAEQHLLCFLSGRGLEDLRRRVGVDSAWYASDHGHCIAGPPGSGIYHEVGGEYRERLLAAGAELGGRLRGVSGVVVEVKGLSVSVHYRLVAHDERAEVDRAVREVAENYPELRLAGGKEVSELMPPGNWGKGSAMLWLMEDLNLSRAELCPVCIGDDLTDEGMFVATEGWGVGVVVGDLQRPTRACYRLDDYGQTVTFLRAVAGPGD